MSATSQPPDNLPADAIERAQREKYRGFYANQPRPVRNPTDYFTKLLEVRVGMVRRYYAGGTVLDLCCGEGTYLPRVAAFAERLLGLDFSPELLAKARQFAAEQGPAPVELIVSNAASLPMPGSSIALVYCFSALYTIPQYERVVSECARVLSPGGVAILDFGILESLNTLVCRAYPELAMPCHVSLQKIHRALRQAGFTIEEDRAFQILPLWGNRPRYLLPLLLSGWKWLLAKEIAGRMLDEWLSSLPGLRGHAFRHLIVCRKPR